MNFLKTNKYSMYSKILKYSFVLVFVFSIALSSLLVNNFTKVANAETPAISVTSTTSNSVTFSISGLAVGASYRLNVYTASDALHSGWDLNRVTSSTVTTTSPSQRPLPPGSYIAKLADSLPRIVATSSPFTISSSTNAVQITSITPSSSKVGDMITITGKNFTYLNGIFFGTVTAFSNTNNDTVITVNVPKGATTGKIKIDTERNGSVTSATDFTVIGSNPINPPNPPTDNGEKTIGDDPICKDVSKKVEFKGLVPICNTVVDSSGGYCDPCDFNMVMNIINKLITFFLVALATPFFAIILIYTGWLYLSSGGSSEKVTKAKSIFKNVIIGYIIALSAWIIVKTILSIVGFTGDSFLG